ncbi:hypothetical protein POM88_011093 [Heracleum sosnowskyi]|uniref:Uncharacterized protein n=1 Tax=Heracleum sosnowskyi TaxID=360622 RepID=A0AAD8IXA3_9APIA|nr:hypothetical protein POM88_011093 [Heracleum sosnowskyi]
MLYFKADGRVYRVGEADIGLKMKEELEYVLYLLKVKNQRTHRADEVLRSIMVKARALCGLKSSGSYIPKYRDYNGKLVEMQRNSARLRTDLGIKVLEFNLESDKSFIIKLGNEMRKNSIYALRTAIYQNGESDPELKELKKIMVAELERAERRLLMDYIRTVPDIEEIKIPSEFSWKTGQSLLNSDSQSLLSSRCHSMKILEAIFFEDGKKKRDIEMAKETEHKTEAILD